MNPNRCLLRLAGLSACLLLATRDVALAVPPSNGDAEWEKVVAQLSKPSEYFSAQKPANREEFELVVKEFEELSLAAANAAAAFQAAFPASRLYQEAVVAEMDMLSSVVRFGSSPETRARLLALEDRVLVDAAAPKEHQYMVEIRRAMEAIDEAANSGGDELAVAEKVLNPLLTRYPEFSDSYGLLLSSAENAPPERTLAVAKRIAGDEKAPEDARAQARGLLAQLQAVGNAMPLAFTALDGREIDLAKMTNKVVLVDFWATWCGPCVREMPRLLKLYDEHHAKGLEIVAISLDESKADLEAFVAKKKIPWPQAFDGRGWQSALAKKFGVNSIPRLWLINKKGQVVSTDARDELEKSIPRLLAE